MPHVWNGKRLDFQITAVLFFIDKILTAWTASHIENIFLIFIQVIEKTVVLLGTTYCIYQNNIIMKCDTQWLSVDSPKRLSENDNFIY